MTTPSEITAALDGMGEEQFSDFIGRHLGPDEPAGMWQVFLSPDVLPRTRLALTALVNDVNLQLAAESARMDALPRLTPGEYHAERREHSAWRARTLGFKRLAERRLRQARDAEALLRRQVHAAAAEQHGHRIDEHTALMERHASAHREAVRLLAIAITAHRQAVVASGVTPEKPDLDLWAALGEISVPYKDGSATVAEMLTSGPWYDAPVTRGRRRGEQP